jgi:hypothetical protein
MDACQKSDPVVFFVSVYGKVVVSATFVVSITISLLGWRDPRIEPPPFTAPRLAIEFVKAQRLSGNVFNSYNLGGFLIFEGIPTFVDGRAELFGDAFLRRYFSAFFLKDIEDAFRLFDEYKIEWAFLEPKEPLTSILELSGAWNKVYSDSNAAVFVRNR